MQQAREAVDARERAYLAEIAVPETDAELKEAFTEGATLAAYVKNGKPANMTNDQWFDTFGKASARLAGYGVLAKQNARLAAELKAAQEQLKRYQSSEPTTETRADPAPRAAAREDSIDPHAEMKAGLAQEVQRMLRGR